MKPLVSVVVVTHNRPLHLRRALNSLRLQRGFQGESMLEIVLCTDEGSHETKAVAKECLGSGDVFSVCPE